MPTQNLRIFIEFAGHFLPILGDAGTYHVMPIPANCSTVNDVAYEIIKKYELQSLSPNGIELKINNKYVLLPSDKVKNSIRESDELHISPRIIPTQTNNNHSSKKRKKHTENNDNQSETLASPPPKKRKISHLNSPKPMNTPSVISNISSASSSVTCYSSSENENENETIPTNTHTLDAIPEHNTNTEDTSSSDDSSEDTSQGSNHNKHNTNNCNDSIEECSSNKEQSSVNSIATINDALKAIQHCKNNMNKMDGTNGYVRTVKVKDRIRVCLNHEWEYGTVNRIDSDIVQLLMDNCGTMNVCLDEMEWDFEPKNFAAPRVLKKIQSMHRNYGNVYGVEMEGCDPQRDIQELIEKCGNQKVSVSELRCDDWIAYKILELKDWAPKESSFKMGTVIGIENETVIVEENGMKNNVNISEFAEIYKIERNDKKVIRNESKIEKTKDQRKKRKRRQKQKKAIARSKST